MRVVTYTRAHNRVLAKQNEYIPGLARRSPAEYLLLFPDEGLGAGACWGSLSDTSLPLFTSSKAGVEGGGTLSSSVSILVSSCSTEPPPPPFSFGGFFLAVEPADLAGGFPFFF